MADIQKKAAHTPRFYQARHTDKTQIQGTPWEVIFNHLDSKFEILNSYVELGTAVLIVKPNDIKFVLSTLKNLGYETLSEMSAIDLLESKGKFELFYQLASYKENFDSKRRIRIKCEINEYESVDSVSEIYSFALWGERETYDMFGIKFLNHPNLSRLLMPKDWVGHPLLRSYPLQGDENAAWYEVDKIFGKDYRDIIGEEQRDSARVELEEESKSFSKIAPLGSESEPLYIDAAKTLFVKNVLESKRKFLQKRR